MNTFAITAQAVCDRLREQQAAGKNTGPVLVCERGGRVRTHNVTQVDGGFLVHGTDQELDRGREPVAGVIVDTGGNNPVRGIYRQGFLIPYAESLSAPARATLDELAHAMNANPTVNTQRLYAALLDGQIDTLRLSTRRAIEDWQPLDEILKTMHWWAL